MTKKQLLNIGYWILLIAMATYVAYSKGWIFSNFTSITPQQAHELLQKGDNVALLDVRTPDEFNQEHIEGALHIPLQTLDKNLGLLDNVKEKKIIVYCRSGSRSVAASRILVKNGFTPLNLTGGITEWKAQGIMVTR